jgi:MFS family permease
VWSFATLATGAVSGFVGLCLMRLLLGIGESVAYPSYSKILMLTLAEHQRGLANAIIDAGTKVGPALGTLIGGLLIARFGWRVLFIGVGAASLVWIVPWLRWAPKIHVRQTAATAAPGFLEIMSRRSAWATFFGLFCYNYAWYFLLTWLPSYLVMERKFTMRMMAVYGALPFAATAVSAVFCGWLSDRQIARGGSVNKVRKTFVVAGVLVTAAALPLATVNSHLVSMISLVTGFAGMGLFTSNSWAVSQTIAGVEASGKWTGLQNGVGNLAGVTAPVITGWIVGRLGSFHVAFVVASAMLVATALLYAFMLGRIEPVRWKKGE